MIAKEFFAKLAAEPPEEDDYAWEEFFEDMFSEGFDPWTTLPEMDVIIANEYIL